MGLAGVQSTLFDFFPLTHTELCVCIAVSPGDHLCMVVTSVFNLRNISGDSGVGGVWGTHQG